MEAYITPDAISDLNNKIYQYKGLIEEQLQIIINEFENLNWHTSRGIEFQSNQIEVLKNEINDIMSIIEDEISPYLHELYENAEDL